MQLSPGPATSRLVDSDGRLRTVGQKAGARLVRVPPESLPIISVAQGDQYGAYISSGGECWSYESWTYGPSNRNPFLLGTDEPPPDSYSQRRIGNLKGVRDIALAKDHALAVDTEGTVWSWGKNATGQLGRPGPATFAEVVPGLERVVAVQAGGSIYPGGGYSVALDEDGVVWTWGDSNFGVLGGLRPQATHSTPTAIRDVPRFVSVAAGFYHVVAIDSKGSLWVWGHNYGRHIGTDSPRAANQKEVLNSRISSPLRLDLGARFTCVSASKQDLTEPPFVCQWTTALDEQGQLWTWGYGSHGTLATGKRKSVPDPGSRTINTPPLVEVAAGAAHAMALDREGGFWVWGGAEQFNNRGSLLGTGDSKGSLYPARLPLVN